MYCVHLQLNPSRCNAGGSIALLLGILLKESRDVACTVEKVVTFGQPMVTDHSGALELSHQAMPLYRVVNQVCSSVYFQF